MTVELDDVHTSFPETDKLSGDRVQCHLWEFPMEGSHINIKVHIWT
jgi:hypothetical protein